MSIIPGLFPPKHILHFVFPNILIRQEKEKGQTLNFEDLSNSAPQKVEFKNLWWDFRKVVDYIQQNEKWLLNGYLQ